jgi:folate-dependent phosphoribosylglycinamide formyltransferase PurN
LVLNLFEERTYPMARKRRQHMRANWANPWRALAVNPYIQPMAFAVKQDAYERPRFFRDGDDSLPPCVETHRVWSVNDADARSCIDSLSPELILVYGTGLVRKEVFDQAPLGAINAHGGKLPRYRGLDTNLWAAYEGRPEDMTLTLHQMDATFDTGPVFASRAVPPHEELSIYSLRYFTTLICTKMFVDLVGSIIAGTAAATVQGKTPSKYYSLMPWLLKRKTNLILRAYAQSGAMPVVRA